MRNIYKNVDRDDLLFAIGALQSLKWYAKSDAIPETEEKWNRVDSIHKAIQAIETIVYD